LQTDDGTVAAGIGLRRAGEDLRVRTPIHGEGYMRPISLAIAAALSFAFTAAIAADVPASVTAAVNDAARPAEDKARDQNRKPGESIAFAGIKAGDKVVDLVPGRGYFTRIFAKAVGPSGKVYAVVPQHMMERAGEATKKMASEYSNVTVLPQNLSQLSVPEPVDVVWTSLNYHDFHNASFGVDIAAFNKGVFNALKSGGTYIIIDHRAPKGSGFTATQTMHRVDPEAVKQEVVAAGFRFDAESDILANAADDLTKPMRDSSVAGQTNQFILRFKKP
jgi:predicted methyltransferase